MSKISLADQAINWIRDLILEGELQPGTHINIAALSKKFDISQTPIREALKKLIAEGLAVYAPKVGYAVRSLTLHEYLQVFEIHQALEVHLVRELAAMPFLVDFPDLGRINDAFEQCVRENNTAGIAETNDRFHRKLYAGYHNKLLTARLYGIWDEVRSLRNLMYDKPVFTKRMAGEHRRILEAIRGGDTDEAGRAMRAHYESGRESAILSFPVINHR